MTGRLQTMRLLPWLDPMGRPCYLSTRDGKGYVSRLADKAEAAQLDQGEHLVECAREILDDAKSIRRRTGVSGS
ncbi:hypothetical protein AB0I22_15375 [Streptomyces sp. NPDC050610]|uniref:hypothetical protein n=1 Tax=Streptomyces sp. NPDC050610 TaxID=3157097 RepID=UPI00341DB8C5